MTPVRFTPDQAALLERLTGQSVPVRDTRRRRFTARRCPICGRSYEPTGRDQKSCSGQCANLLRIEAANGCKHCSRGDGLCDDHLVPPVCVCDQPAPDAIGQCSTCLHTYKPQVPGFTACRDAWRTQLAQEAVA